MQIFKEKPAAPGENREPSWELGNGREASRWGGDGRWGSPSVQAAGPISCVPPLFSLGHPWEPGCIQSWRGSAQRCQGVRVCQEQGNWFPFELQKRDFPYGKKIKLMEEDLIWQEGCY